MPLATAEFQVIELAEGASLKLEEQLGRTTAVCWDGSELACDQGRSYFGFAQSGSSTLETQQGEFPLAQHMFFCSQGGCIRGGRGLLIAQEGFDGCFHLGGPIESRGRLRYIDGCTDTLLIPPIRRGDPCLNLLHVPPGVSQTEHTHPSGRIGLIVRGEGVCNTAGASEPLRAGSVFAIPAGVEHSFHTQDNELLIVAYHPDSDFGPTDEDHPMINRTVINEPAGLTP